MKEQVIEIKTREEYLRIFKLLWQHAFNIELGILDFMASDNSVQLRYINAISTYERWLLQNMYEVEGDWDEDDMYSIKFEQLWNGEFHRELMSNNAFRRIKFKFKRKHGFYRIPKDVMRVIEEAHNDW